MVTREVRALLFDMDGVILQTMPAHFRAWRSVLAGEGLSVSRLDVYRREGQQGLQSVRELFEEYGRPLEDETARRLLRRKESLFKEIVRPRFVPGARSFLREAVRRGITAALVTGTSRGEVGRILPEEVRGIFACVVAGDDVRRGKPDPEPYRTALDHIGCPAAEAAVIENAPLGIRSAKSAGLFCVALETSLSASYLSEADIVVKDYRDLRGRVRFAALMEVAVTVSSGGA